MPKGFKLRHVNEITGAFVLLVVAMLIVSIVLMGWSQRWFTKTRSYTLQLPNAGAMGLRTGADVWVLGSVVGSVEDINVNDDGKMYARISVRSNAGRFIKGDSQAVVRKTLGIGDAYIEFEPGGKGDEALPGSTLSQAKADRAPTEMLEETIGDIRREIVPAVREARLGFAEYKNLAADLRKPDSNLQQALARVNSIAATVERGDGLAGKVLADPKLATQVEQALPKVHASLDELQLILADVHKTTGTIASQRERTLERVQALLANMEKTTASLPPTVASINRTAESLPALVLQMQETLRQIQRLAEGMQRSWLLRGAMEGDAAGGRIPPEGVSGGGR